MATKILTKRKPKNMGFFILTLLVVVDNIGNTTNL